MKDLERERAQKKEYYIKNKEAILKRNKEWDSKNRKIRSKAALKNYHKNKEEILAKKKKDYLNDPEKYRQKAQERRKTEKYKKWKINRAKKDREYRRLYYREKLQDTSYRLRKNISRSVNGGLKRLGASKAGESIMNFLPYSIDELKCHLESQFEDWMTWENWGTFNGNKRTWHIDHIISQSKLPYDSMDHPNFLKCWALENLRPLDAISNIKKGQ